MSGKPSIAEIKVMLQARIRDVCVWLAPGGRFEHGRYVALNPTRADRKMGSFVIWTGGNACGAFKDFAAGDADKGDVFDLVQYCLGLQTKSGAYDAALTWLGGAAVFSNPKLIANARADSARRAERDEVRQKREIAENRDKAKGWWLAQKSSLLGTPAETYLMADRAINLRELARPPGALRFAHDMRHGPTQTSWPGIMALMSGPAGETVAVHRTFLTASGKEKAPIKPPRLIWPRGWAGGKIPLARGESNLPERQAGAKGVADTLVISEGIEDGLTIALACPEYRVWAAGTLGNMAQIRIPDCAAEVVIAADNDWTKRQASDALKTAIAVIEAQGVAVRVARSFIGKDFNDMARA